MNESNVVLDSFINLSPRVFLTPYVTYEYSISTLLSLRDNFCLSTGFDFSLGPNKLLLIKNTPNPTIRDNITISIQRDKPIDLIYRSAYDYFKPHGKVKLYYKN